MNRNRYGEGSVYKMKDGRYGAAVSLGRDENGKRCRHIVTGKTEREVIDKMRRWLAQNGYIEKEEVLINGQSTIDELVEEFKKNSLLGTISDATYENYSYSLKYVKDHFSGRRLATIDKDDLKRFFISMVNATENGEYRYSQATINRVTYITTRMYTRAVEKGWLPSNPMADKSFRKIEAKKVMPPITAIDKEDVKLLMELLKERDTLYAVIYFMLHTGTRTQEALALKWKDIDFGNDSICIQRALCKVSKKDEDGNAISSSYQEGPTKTKDSRRAIGVPHCLIEFLEDWRKHAPTVSCTKTRSDDFVFGNHQNPRWSCDGFRKSVNRYLQSSAKRGADIGMHTLRLHRLRHTVATMLSDEPGATVFHIMQLLGHSDSRMSQKYIDSNTESRRKANQVMLGNIAQRYDL